MSTRPRERAAAHPPAVAVGPARRALLRAAGALLATAAAPLRAHKPAPPELGTLLATIARQTVPRAKFYERKHIALLDTPVDSTGDLLFVAPSRLEKHTLSPQAESMVIDGDTLTLTRGGTRRTMSLQQLPEAAPLVDSLRATLAADARIGSASPLFDAAGAVAGARAAHRARGPVERRGRLGQPGRDRPDRRGPLGDAGAAAAMTAGRPALRLRVRP